MLGALALSLAVGICVVGSFKTIEICDSGTSRQLRTKAQTVAGALDEAGIKLLEGDKVEPSPETKVKNGLRVVVKRSVAVRLIVDGTAREVRTCCQLVKDVLAENGIEVGDGYRVSPALEEQVPVGGEIRVSRVETKEVVEKVAVPYGEKRIEDRNLERGLSRVIQAGSNGLKEIKYQVTYVDGVMTEKRQVSENLVKPPVERVVAMGTAGNISRGGRTIRFSRALEVVATAYTPGPESNGIYTDGYTATGMKATYGVVAVDPRVIPLGSRLYVDGYGFAVAADTGGAIKNNRIDVCFDSLQEALNWGIRKVKVYILE